MPPSFSETMLKASRLTGLGKLMDATRLIQHTLLGTPPAKAKNTNHPNVVDVAARVVTPTSPTQVQTPQPARPGKFTQHQFSFGGDTYPYRLYIPAAAQDGAKPMPLVVLLHGCKQDALDFSNGTAMNQLADEHHAMVLYPEQITSANAMRCWNWFEPAHQQAGKGEVGMIAALTQKVTVQHDANPRRVYIAGLSAGGAMAAVVANLYPTVFAALGVHSGLAAGAAQDVMSAFAAMRSGPSGSAKTTGAAMPTIVFHGTADKTVHPDNGQAVTDAALSAFRAAGISLEKTKTRVDVNTTQPAERVAYSTASGKPCIEDWRINQGTHAWSGGSAKGSYTDPDGPDASAAMLAFFLHHKLAA